MRSKVAIFGHALHPMLVAFPIAFYGAAVVSYIVYGVSENLFWFRLGVVANVAGVVMAAVAAIPGFIDWLLAIPTHSPAKLTGLRHMLANLMALSLFAINAGIQVGRFDDPLPNAVTPIALSLFGLVATVVAGFFGWALVQKHHVGVELTPEQERLEPDLQERRPPVGTTGAQRT